MAEISIGGALGSGIGLIARRPLTVLVGAVVPRLHSGDLRGAVRLMGWSEASTAS